jgi:hypothetical protein
MHQGGNIILRDENVTCQALGRAYRNLFTVRMEIGFWSQVGGY